MKKILEEKDPEEKEISEMRDHLIDKCETIFQNKDNEYLKEYMEEKDPEEKEYKLSKLKKFVFGNVYFITELMNIKIISKKIGPSCLRHLFDRYNKEKDNKILREITLEAIIIFTDQFGSLIHREKEKKPNADLGEINNKIDECFNKLEKIKDEPNLVGHLKFKIINLIEKRKNNYVQTEFEKSQIAKSKKEVEKELEKEGILTQDFINKKILNGLKDYKESLLKEIEFNFKQIKKNAPEKISEKILTYYDQFITLSKGSEKDHIFEKLEILNTIVNNTSEAFKTLDEIPKNLKKNLSNLKKSLYQLNSIRNISSYITKIYKNGKYEGEYLNGKREGKGIYKYNNGDKYEGNYKNDLKEGNGTYKYKNGDVYTGEYKNGLFDGKGKYEYADGEIFKWNSVERKRKTI